MDLDHALAPAAGGGLDQQREAHLNGAGGDLLIIQSGGGKPGGQRHAAAGHQLLGLDLVRHGLQCGDLRANQGDARGLQGPGEHRVFGEETVAGVHGRRPAVPGGLHHLVDVKVAVGGRGRAQVERAVGLLHVPGGGVRGRVDGDRVDAQGLEGTNHANGDLTAVRHKNFVKQVHGYILKIPKLVSGSCSPSDRDRAMPSTRRVSTGSITPSSHNRAVE